MDTFDREAILDTNRRIEDYRRAGMQVIPHNQYSERNSPATACSDAHRPGVGPSAAPAQRPG